MNDPEETGSYKPDGPINAALPPHIGRYRVERILGRGGFGLVYLGYDDQLQRPVAIKVPHPHRITSADDAKAYLTEARTVANLDQPNIVPVYDVGNTEDFPCFIVSKFIEGSTLAQKISSGERPTFGEAAELVATIAEALHHAHKQGLVHGDVKPGNILLDKRGKPFVVDFGLALREQDVGNKQRYAGTPAYMSPEQARGEGHRVDGRSDIFSLGVVFYELLTGVRPFKAESQAELLEQITSLEARPPRQIDDAIPKELERICLKALSKRASDRYSTAKDFAEDLRHFIASSLARRVNPTRKRGSGSSSDQRAKVVRSTFLFADFKGYTERVRILEKAAGHQAAAEIKRMVDRYVDEVLRLLEGELKPDDYELISTAGDGFFFHFRLAKDAFRFAEALQQNTTSHNAHVADELAEHWFRIGAATGDAAWDDGQPVGHAVNVASRLQSASAGGDFVVDQPTYDDLPLAMRNQFGPKETIRDKHDKTYDAYRTAFGRALPQPPQMPLPSPIRNQSNLTTPVCGSTADSDSQPIRIVPKGLRSFDSDDADFFLELLPGPRDREGLPDSLRFWKTRIESIDADRTFAVGLIYGPSGCGKSSLVKAGLLPRLAAGVAAVYVEATGDDTEARLLKGLRRQIPKLPGDLGLIESLTALRRGRFLETGRKVVLVLDQFEQWLHAKQTAENSELVKTLGQCDGGRVQCIVMVRDDFWLAVSRFMQVLDVRIVEAENSRLVDLFDARHARKVLGAFGRAFGALPEREKNQSKEQEAFLDQAVDGLAQAGKVISVRLALFAEMVKGKTWNPATLTALGGTEGVGASFLEETFTASTAPPQHRLHQKAAQAVLKVLLPESGAEIKGHMRSRQELLQASSYASRPRDFDELLRILDSELRLITPTDPEGAESASPAASTRGELGALSQPRSPDRCYQLTHDYLVPSLRDWLTRKQKETRRGRAELLLADRAVVWNARPENRQLPSLLQWFQIRRLTVKKNWLPPQRKMMRAASRYHALRGVIVALILALIGLGSWEGYGRLEGRRLRDRLLESTTGDVPGIVKDMAGYRRWVDPLLRDAYSRAEKENDRRKQLHVSLALLPMDSVQVEFLYERLLKGEPQEVAVIREALLGHKTDLSPRLWEFLENQDKDQDQRFRAACALAVFAPDDPRWEKASGNVAATLVIQKPFVIGQWTETVKGVGPWLVPHLTSFLVDEKRTVSERGLIATVYGAYAGDIPDAYTRLEERMTAKSGPNAIVDARIALAKEQASVGVALMAMGRSEKVWPLLKHSPDPTSRSYLIERLGMAGVDPKVLSARLEEKQDVSIKRAILLSLGEFGLDRLSLAERRNHLPWLLQLYRADPDSGIHGAAEWLLRQWGALDELTPIEKELATGKVEADRQWYVNRQRQTMIVVLKPAEFQMGDDGEEDNKRYRKRIGRNFAIAATEVTVDQFRQFRKEYEPFKDNAPTGDCPANMLSWYDAAAYCNWLSEKEGLDKEKWCYLPNKAGKYDNGMTMAPDYLKRTGYRLPTEAEWEYSCRAGSEVAYSLGESVELLGRYAWFGANSLGKSHPVGTLKPNDLGLFDMHGNDWEWCQGIYAKKIDKAVGDSDDQTIINPDDSRVLRGGSFNYQPSYVRSAYRNNVLPDSRYYNDGFRLARTLTP